MVNVDIPLTFLFGFGSQDNDYFWEVGCFEYLYLGRIFGYLASVWLLGNCRRSEGLLCFSPSNGTNFAILLILAWDIE